MRIATAVIGFNAFKATLDTEKVASYLYHATVNNDLSVDDFYNLVSCMKTNFGQQYTMILSFSESLPPEPPFVAIDPKDADSYPNLVLYVDMDLPSPILTQ